MYFKQLINQSSLSIDYEIIMKSAEEGFRSMFYFNIYLYLYLLISSTANGNVNGTAIFDCVPASGSILPGSCVQIAVTFQPDHANNQLVDKMKIILFENVIIKHTLLKKISFIYVYCIYMLVIQ